ncbi:MAG: WYL domain-containing protein [Acetobacter fabarum]|jgi:predicted DNA-binding transcriptional regulator YafY|nr:WYL domain-containing protein [Acetobacter fabarum]
MQFLIGVIAIMGLIYYGTGYLGVSDHARFNIAVWGGLALGVLGAIGNALNKISPKSSVTTTQAKKSKAERAPEGLSRRTVEGVRVIIRYMDGSLDETERTIRPDLLEYTTDPDGTVQIKYIHAYCELRKAPRLFRYDRLEGAYNADTGEEISNIGALLWSHHVES